MKIMIRIRPGSAQSDVWPLRKRPLDMHRSICSKPRKCHRGWPNLRDHHFEKHLSVYMSTDCKLLYPWFNCSTTAIVPTHTRNCVKRVMIKDLCLEPNSLCTGYCVLGI